MTRMYFLKQVWIFLLFFEVGAKLLVRLIKRKMGSADERSSLICNRLGVGFGMGKFRGQL